MKDIYELLNYVEIDNEEIPEEIKSEDKDNKKENKKRKTNND